MCAMQAYPETVIEFRERFATEQACRDYVAARFIIKVPVWNDGDCRA